MLSFEYERCGYDSNDEGYPYIQAKPQDVVGEIDTKRLNSHPTQTIERDVKQESISGLKSLYLWQSQNRKCAYETPQ